jgi:hypothetical protein
MLLYNKSLDPMHTLLRVSTIIFFLKKRSIEKDRLRLFDFILSNPSFIPQMSLGKDVQKEKNYFKIYENKYRVFDARNLFESMRPIQDAVFYNLVGMEVLEEIEYGAWFEMKPDILPGGLKEIIVSSGGSVSFDVIDFLNTVLSEVEFLGAKGLKDRSGLMEHRYDAV